MIDGLHTLLPGYGTWVEMSSSVALLVKDRVRVIFDSGADAEKQNLIKALDELNLRPEDIDIVVNTHLHMDHCENNPIFTQARWYCSDAVHDGLIELVVALNTAPVDLNSIAARYLALPGGMPKTLYGKVERFLMRRAIPEKILQTRRIGQRELNQVGIGVIDTPGHCDGHVSFVCHNIRKHMDVIFAGDAIISQDHFQPGRRALFTKHDGLAERSKEQLAALSGWCIPGHGAAFRLPDTCAAPIGSTLKNHSLCKTGQLFDRR